MMVDIKGPIKYAPLLGIFLFLFLIISVAFEVGPLSVDMANKLLLFFGIFMFIGIVSFIAWSCLKMKNRKSRKERLEEIRLLVGGYLEQMEKVCDEYSCKILFDYKNRSYEFLDLLEISSVQGNIHSVQKEISMRTKTSTMWTLKLKGVTGESFIGKTADKLGSMFLMSDCEDITKDPALSAYRNKKVKIYTTSREEAITFLNKIQTQEVIFKYIQQKNFSCNTFPVSLDEGFISFVFQEEWGNNIDIYQNLDKFISYLEDLRILANQINENPTQK